MASTYLTKTFSTATSQKKGTISFWFKTCKFTSTQGNFFSTYENDNNRTIMKLNGDSQFEFQARSGGNVDLRFDTTRKFRDTNAWYHIVIATDTTLATAADRCKIYVNGVQETSFATSTIPTQNVQPHYLYNNMTKVIGAYANGPANYFDGIMSHFHFTDGYVYAASDFGETDSTTGEWKIKASPTGITYGNNGFFILKDGNSVTDQSGNSNNFTVGGGTLTKTEDCPSNVFCTLNPLSQDISGYASGNAGVIDIQNGNTFGNKVTHGAYLGTIGVSSGKYYWEVKVGDTNQAIGIVAMRPTGGVTYIYDDATANLYYPYSDYYYTNGSAGSSGSGDFDNTSNKIYSFALDATNNKLWIGRDGTFVGDPANGTGATWASLPTGHEWTPVMHSMSTSQNNYAYFNFGNGYFGTTAVSSAGTNASGIGIFEYNVPTGFTALSTKGLNL
tara:strand:- start:70 stop:1407 length:1338 start_codon:yes stop_codon:yes gene_type:complete